MAREISIKLSIHDSSKYADAYDAQTLKSLTGEQKLTLALRMMSPYYETTQRLERVYRVVEQGKLPISDNWRVGI
jgi:hypothetical protein